MTPWDRRLFLRAFAGAVLAFVVVVIVTAATDAGATMARRVMTSLPALPFASGFGAYVALAGARRERELSALDVTGVSQRRARLFAWLGATIPGALLALTVVLPAVDASVIYPQVRLESRWNVVTDVSGSAFSSEDLGVTVTSDGGIHLRDPVASRSPISSDGAHRIAGAIVLAGMAAAWALAFAGVKKGRSFRVFSLSVASLAITLLFQLTAANRIVPILFVATSLMSTIGAIVLPQMIERARRTDDTRGASAAGGARS